jgi:hypothetical protein
MEELIKISGERIVHKGFTLVEYLKALKVGQDCIVMTKDFGIGTIQVTASRLKKQGMKFFVKTIRIGKRPIERVRVTRME